MPPGIAMTTAHRRFLASLATSALSGVLLAACAEAPPAGAPAQPVSPAEMRAGAYASPPPPVAAVAPPPAAPAPEPPPPPPMGKFEQRGKGIDAEMLAIADAENQIDKLILEPKKAKDRGPGKGPKGAGNKADDVPPPPNGEACATACRALSSMRRSADHLCSLAGERDGRCEDARARVTGATSRVSAQCPACPSP